MKAVIVVVTTLLSAAAAQSIEAIPSCQGGFDPVGSACYHIPDMEYDWITAMDYCRKMDLPNGKLAALARVESCDQLSSVWDYIGNLGLPIVDYWLGGTSALDASGAFRWDSTGELVPTGVPFWFPGQPDRPVQERTLSLSKTGYFADENETIAQRFICQLL